MCSWKTSKEAPRQRELEKKCTYMCARTYLCYGSSVFLEWINRCRFIATCLSYQCYRETLHFSKLLRIPCQIGKTDLII